MPHYTVKVETLEPRSLLSLVPVAGEVGVNGNTGGDQWTRGGSQLAADAAGNFTAVWATEGQQPVGVFLRRFDATGVPLGDDQRVNSASLSAWYPAVSSNAAGDTVVVWMGGDADVFARAYTPAGVARGPAVRVNSTVAGNQRFPDVSVAADGSFAVAWEGSTPDFSPYRGYVRRFTADATPLTGEITLTGWQSGAFPAVGSNRDGSFTASWLPGGVGGVIHARRFDSAARPLGDVFVAAVGAEGTDLYRPTVRADADGDFVLAWYEYDSGSGREYQVKARQFHRTGAPAGEAFTVNAVSRNQDVGSGLGVEDDGSFVITWATTGDAAVANADLKTRAIYARRFFPDGQPDGGDVKVNPPTSRPYHRDPSVAVAPGGRVMVTYTGGADDHVDGDLFARRLISAADRLPPAARIAEVAPDPRTAPVDALSIRFTEPVTGFDLSDLRLTRDGGADLLPAGATLTADDATRWTLGNLAALTASPGRYTLSLPATGSGVADAAGVALGGDAAETWDVLPAETTRPAAQFVTPFSMLSPVPAATVRFGEYVTGVDLSDFTLTLDGQPVPLDPGRQRVVPAGDNRFVLYGLHELTDMNGRYVLRLNAAGSGIVDLWGNPLAADATYSWQENQPTPAVTGVFVASRRWNPVFLSNGLAWRGLGNNLGFAVRADDQANEIPWVGLDTITVEFNEHVQFPDEGAEDLLRVTGVNVAEYEVASFSYDWGDFVATWRLARPIGADRITVRLDDKDVAGYGRGRALDGEWAGGADAFPSGDGAPGGDFAFGFNVLPGDVNRDGRVNVLDHAEARARANTNALPPVVAAGRAYSPFADLDGTGGVTGYDAWLAHGNYGAALPVGSPPSRVARATSLLTSPSRRGEWV